MTRPAKFLILISKHQRGLTQSEPGFVREVSCDFVDPSCARGRKARRLGLILLMFLLIESGALALGLQPRTTKTTSSRADDLFRQNCARCHGAEGRGDTPLGKTLNAPDFTDTDWWQKHSDITSSKSLAGIVNHGKGGMPAFGKKLTRTEINLLVGYVRKFRKKT